MLEDCRFEQVFDNINSFDSTPVPIHTNTNTDTQTQCPGYICKKKCF